MPRPNWNGRRVTEAVAWVVRRDHGICHFCGHPGANSLDHLMPASTHPHLEWVRSNWRAAHLTRAGTPDGCTTPGCHCPGNKGRKAQPWTPPPSRTW